MPLWFEMMSVGVVGGKHLACLKVISKQKLHYRFLQLKILARIQMQQL